MLGKDDRAVASKNGKDGAIDLPYRVLIIVLISPCLTGNVFTVNWGEIKKEKRRNTKNLTATKSDTSRESD